MKRTISTSNTNSDNIEVIATRIEYIQRDVADIRQKLEGDYVTEDEFAPIKKIVYGMVGAILLTVLGAFLTLVLRQQ